MNQSINLNLIPDGVKPVAKVSQFDVGRVVTFSLYQGPDVYTPPAGTTLEFRELKPDKHICVYDDAATLSGSTITLETTQQMTAAAGEALCQFKLTNGTEVLATLNFWLDVQTDPAAEGDISDSDIPGIIALATEQMERAEAAADSAAADAESAADSKEDAETAATSADASATAAEGCAEDAEAYAVGTRGGTDVQSTDPAYHNNSKYYSDLASAWAAHPPYVGANGDWYVYDPTTQQFVDTGIDASITMQIQDVTMLSYGSTPTVTNSGTSTDAVFHLGIPRAATIASVQKTSTSGLVDTYTMTLQDGTTFTYTVTNGADGQGSVDTVNNIAPVGGNVTVGLGDLEGVDLSTLSDGDVLVYDLATGKWINGGAVGGGHTIENPSGTAMAQRSNLQFKGRGVTVTDDSVNNTTVVEITGGGGTTIVQKPTVTVGTYTYNGTAQGPTITGLDAEHCTVTNATKIDAGTYTLTISLKNTSTMVWSDLTTADITAEYTIAKKSVTIPTVSGSFTYDGTEKTATIGNTGDSAYYTQGGTASATDAGTYTVTFTLNDTTNTKWSDDSTAQKSGTWTIAKATGSVTLSKNSITLSGNTTSDTVTISGGTGAISISSSDTTVATVSPSSMSASGGTLTVTSPNKKSGTATITVSVAGDANHNATSKTISFTGNYTVIYGVQWDGTSTTAMSRTDGAASFTDPVPAVNNGNGSSPFDTISPWKDMVKETRNGNVMVKIPKFYFKWTKTGTTMKLQICMSQESGFQVAPAFMDRGDGKGERDYVYVARYHCASDYKSKTGVQPEGNHTRAEFRSSIHSLGSNIWQLDYAMLETIWMLYLVEFADWDSQKKIGKGCSDAGSKQNNGLTDSMTYHTGTNAANRDTFGHVQYRWIEDLWGNVYDWCDGIYFSGADIYVIKNPADFSDTANGTKVGTRPTTGNYIKAWAFSSVSGFGWFLYPSEVGGSDSTYTPDYCDYNASGVVLYVGGNYHQNQGRGLFYLDGNVAASNKNAYVGSRLQELP